MSALIILTNTTSVKRVTARNSDVTKELTKEGTSLLKPMSDTEWATGFYSPSFVYPYKALKKEGLKITTCSPSGGLVKVDPWSLELWDHPVCNNCLKDPVVKDLLENTEPPQGLKGSDYDIIHFVGGHGNYFDLATHPEINRIVAECYENNGIISCNSDGAVGLLNVKLSTGQYLVKGKTITGFSKAEQERLDGKDDMPFSLECELKKQGADFKPGKPVKDQVTNKDRLLCGQNPNSSEPLSRLIANTVRKALKAKKSVLYILTNVDEFPDKIKTGTFVSSFVYPYRELRKAGMNQVIATPKGGVAPIDPWSLELWDHPLTRNLLAEDSVKSALENTIPIKDIKPEEFGAVIFTGGYGGLFDLVDNADVHRVVSKIYENGGIITCNGHGSAGLLNCKLSNGEFLLKGKTMTALPKNEEDSLTAHSVPIIHNFPINLESELKKRGANFKAGVPVKGHVQIHEGQIITGQNPNSSEFIARKLTAAMKAKAKK